MVWKRSLSDLLGTVVGLDEQATTPPATLSGVDLFSRNRARRALAVVGPNGVDTAVQSSIAANKVSWLTATANNVAISANGMVGVQTTAPTSVAVAPGITFFEKIARARFSTAATAGAGNGLRSSPGGFFRSTIPHLGGFHAVFRFGVSASTPTSRVFVGFALGSGALSTADPSTLTHILGIGNDSADANLHLIHNDGTTAVKTDLGANFPCRDTTLFYDVIFYCPSGAGDLVYWAIRRVNDGIQVQGGPITTKLPTQSLVMAPHINISNGTTAAIASIDVQSIYVETDN